MGGSCFDPWVRKIPWRREWLPTPVFWPGEFHELYGVAKVGQDWATSTFTITKTINLELLELEEEVAWFEKSSAFLYNNQPENIIIERSYLPQQEKLLNY